jgi:hypothetical protein
LQEWLNQGYQEYEKRLRPVLSLETVWHKTDEELLGAVEKDRASRIVCLDEHGKQFTSEEFADVLYKRLESGEARSAGLTAKRTNGAHVCDMVCRLVSRGLEAVDCDRRCRGPAPSPQDWPRIMVPQPHGMS